MVNTMTISELVTSTAPMTSAPPAKPCPTSEGTNRSAARATKTPIGTLTKKIQCQLTACVMTPPASSPTAPPADATNAKTPIALACSRGCGNIATIIPSTTDEVSAPPAPWTNRAMISTCWFPARPHRADAAVNTPSPVRKTRRRPARSPNRPASSSSPPNAIRYAFTTHARAAAVKCSSVRIDGSATFTMVASSTIMSMLPHST